MSNKRDTLISKVFKRYLIDAMGAMAYGLFASLIIGTIIGQFATFPGLEFLANIATVLKNSMVYGAAIGAAVAWGLKSDPVPVPLAASQAARWALSSLRLWAPSLARWFPKRLP